MYALATLMYVQNPCFGEKTAGQRPSRQSIKPATVYIPGVSSPPHPPQTRRNPARATLPHVTKGGWRTPAEIGPTHAALTLDLIRVMPA